MTTRVTDLSTPCLLVDADAFAANVATMAEARPGRALRPHVKAFKSTDLARELVAAGHDAFCCATPAEVVGMAQAGMGADLLLANEVLDRAPPGDHGGLAPSGPAITVAVDSRRDDRGRGAGGGPGGAGRRRGRAAAAAAATRPRPRALADAARAAGLEVRGVMGYEGHLMMETEDKAAKVEASMAALLAAHQAVGGDVVSGGGTGTWDLNTWVTELQAGSYTLMDGQYLTLDSPFRPALTVGATVISVNRAKGWAVADAGLKSLSTDHGDPTIEGHRVWFCSDEHTTFGPREGTPMPRVGDRVALLPGHVDPTVALHDRLHVVRGDEVLDTWAVDLRGWDPPVP